MAGEPTGRTARPGDGRLRAVVEAHPVLSFAALSFAWSWGIWGALWLVVGPADLNYVATWPGLWGPLVAALVVTWLRGTSVRAWLARALRWRVAARWYLIAVGGVFLLDAVSPVVQAVLAGSSLAPASPITLLLSMTVAVFAGGSEELGWRGFLHPALRDRFDALVAGTAIGVLWAVWHLPLLWLGITSDVSFPLFAAAVVPLSVAFGWLYDSTGGSAFVVVLAHAAFDAAAVVTTTGPSPDDVVLTSQLVAVGCYWLVVVGLLAVYGRRLSRTTERPSPSGDATP
ncbi:CPBP family intramembrane glutamic endopeptidase [Halomicrobium salinisoli]|uniref:CPBP family intramembrane glutamic endopeptidase n=1 Tax=Halomicrobium salinisoli TaxID=2878391 RepID=UPI001CEFF808|nr:type II CAAX endopeptidase family protein [Halomicrobium salinisoli]